MKVIEMNRHMVLGFSGLVVTIALIQMIVASVSSMDESLIVACCSLLQASMVFVFTCLLFCCFPKISRYILIWLVAICCAVETIYGLFQLFGLRSSNHLLYSMTGSFSNPGPFGGFLSICISLVVAYYIKGKDMAGMRFSKVLIPIGVISAIILPSVRSRSALLALACSLLLLTFNSRYLKRKITPFIRKHFVLVLTGLLLIGCSAYLLKKRSADGRLFMDRISLMAMKENKWKGSGFGSFGGEYADAQTRFFKQQMLDNGTDDLCWEAIDEKIRLTADAPEYAFNEYLQIGIENGLLLMLLFIGVIFFSIVISFRKGTVWCYGVTSFAVFAFFSYPLQEKEFQILLPVLIAAIFCDGYSWNGNGQKLFRYIKIVSLIVLLTELSIIYGSRYSVFKQYQWFESCNRDTERLYQMEKYNHVVADCEKQLTFLKNNHDFLLEYGQALNKCGDYIRSDSILTMGTRISSNPLFWNIMGNNSMAMGNYREAESRYKHAFHMVPNRLYPLYKLALLYKEEGDTTRFLMMAEKVEDFIPKVDSNMTEQMRNEIATIKKGYLKMNNR